MQVGIGKITLAATPFLFESCRVRNSLRTVSFPKVTHMTWYLRILASVVCGVGCVLAVGCGTSGPKLYPVRGTVTVKGKPAHHAIVFLHRKGRTDMAEHVPYGKVAADGTFVITSTKEGDGAQVGEYAITIYWPDMSKPEDGNGQRPDALNGAYDKVAQSKLSAVMKAEENVISPLDLTPGAPQRKAAADPNDK